jgi:ABC-type polysaccharide/polyol phosphate transport system ATPase subunit
MSEPAIRLTGVGKRYTKYEDAPMLITAALKLRARSRRSDLWAVRNIDLEAEPGECVGVIGRNGSGKSTMLQMLAGVTAPTEGRVVVRGRVAPLISVGVGFHPELTGRENVYVNGSILGLSRTEISRRFDAIVDFAEIEAFIDTPVKFYSSGMFVRLGFAVAVQAEPDVLLVDEVLAVGDMAFQLKCFDRMQEIRASGTTIAVVSHNLNAVRLMCDRTTVLHEGTQRFLGPTSEAIGLLHALLDEERDLESDEADPSKIQLATGYAEIESFQLVGVDGGASAHLHAGEDPLYRVSIRFDRDVDSARLAFTVLTSEALVYSEAMDVTDGRVFRAGDRAQFDVRLRAQLATGTFRAVCGLYRADLSARFCSSNEVSFFVSGRSVVSGPVDLGAHVEVVMLADAAGTQAEPPPLEGSQERPA